MRWKHKEMKRRQGCLVADLKKAKYVCLFFFFLLHVKTSFRSPMTIYNDDVSFFSSNSSCRANLHRHTLHCTSKAIGKDSIANSNLFLRLASLLLLVIRLPLSSTNQTKPTSTCRSVIFFFSLLLFSFLFFSFLFHILHPHLLLVHRQLGWHLIR